VVMAFANPEEGEYEEYIVWDEPVDIGGGY